MKTKLPEERKYIRNRRFLEQIERNGLPSREVGKDILKKLKYLRAYGYTALYIGPAEGVDIDKCNPGRLNMAFFRTYENAKKQVEKFEEAAKHEREKQSLVSLVTSIESEKGLHGEELVEAQERTSIMMESASQFVLKYLSREYGEEVLGGFYQE